MKKKKNRLDNFSKRGHDKSRSTKIKIETGEIHHSKSLLQRKSALSQC